MSASAFTFIGLAVCVLIVLALCILAIRRFDSVDLGEKQESDVDDVLELHQLSFDQVASVRGNENAQPEPATGAEEDYDGGTPDSSAASQPASAPALGTADFGIRPERLILDEMRPRLEFAMALLNQTDTTLVSLRVISDLVIFNAGEKQAVRPSASNMRQDTLARLAPGERIIIQGNWKVPDGLAEMLSAEDGEGAYALARARVIGANVAPKSQYFLIGHLLEDSRLVAIRNTPEALNALGVTEAKAATD